MQLDSGNRRRQVLDTNDGGLDCNRSRAGIDSADVPNRTQSLRSRRGCSLHRSTACNTCVADKCCAEFEACNPTPIASGLIDYAFCLGNNFTSDAGATCDENFFGRPARRTRISPTALSSSKTSARRSAAAKPSVTIFAPPTAAACRRVCNHRPLRRQRPAPRSAVKFDASAAASAAYHCSLANRPGARTRTNADPHCWPRATPGISLRGQIPLVPGRIFRVFSFGSAMCLT